MPEILYEDDVVDYLNDTIDYAIENCGIGYYEYGDGKYNDVSMQMVLTDQEIMVQYTTDVEQYIYTMLSGTVTDNEHEAPWIANLCQVVLNPEDKTLDATYEIVED